MQQSTCSLPCSLFSFPVFPFWATGTEGFGSLPELAGDSRDDSTCALVPLLLSEISCLRFELLLFLAVLARLEPHRAANGRSVVARKRQSHGTTSSSLGLSGRFIRYSSDIRER